MNRKDFEIMAPVGSWESLYAAQQGGADAIYFGIEGLNMRYGMFLKKRLYYSRKNCNFAGYR